jgi:hypothetical protein
VSNIDHVSSRDGANPMSRESRRMSATEYAYGSWATELVA